MSEENSLKAGSQNASRFRLRAKRDHRSSQIALSPAQRAIFYLLLAAIHSISLLPDFVLERMGRWGALLVCKCDRRHVKVALKNLEIAFPNLSPAERQRILRESYLNLGHSAAEYVRLGGFFYRRMLGRVSYQGLERWDAISRRYPGRGMIVLTAHFGNFELLSAAHAMHGYQISLVHHTQRFAPGDALMTFVRERAGVEIIRKHAAARAVLRALREGEMIGIPFDQNAKRSEAVFVPFFGELAATASGLARLVRMARAPVVPVFIVRNPDGRTHRIEVGEELALVHTADVEADIIENTRRFVAEIEAAVRRYPEQFLWFHRRFRTRPVGAPRIYEEKGIRARRAERAA